MALRMSQLKGCSRSPLSTARRPPVREMRSLVLARVAGEYPDADLIAATREAFPEKGVANVEEARCLWADGWAYVDVRPTLEIDEMGKVAGSVCVPVKNMIKKYNPETQEKDYIKSDNKEEFMKMMKKKFQLDSKIMIACSDGTSYSMDALEALDEAGYVNIVGVKGGYYSWFRTWDNKLQRRRGDGFVQNAMSESGDSMGIHSTGGGFENIGKIEKWVPKKY